MTLQLAKTCIYTIVAQTTLDELYDTRQPLEQEENRVWRAGSLHLKQARKAGEALPILFADAAYDTTALIYWGLLEDIRLGSGRTRYRVDRLRRLPRGHAPQELVLLSTGKTIAPNFIRPYALCQTPTFLSRGASRNIATLPEDPEILSFKEGEARRRFVLHRHREQELRRKKIAQALRAGKNRLRCEVPGCGLDFEAVYGKTGKGYTQVHHLRPLAEGEGSRATSLADLAVVCANCHVMIHLGGKCRPLAGLI
jgi:hypothetical protein